MSQDLVSVLHFDLEEAVGQRLLHDRLYFNGLFLDPILLFQLPAVALVLGIALIAMFVIRIEKANAVKRARAEAAKKQN